jgi:hypothetical protein
MDCAGNGMVEMFYQTLSLMELLAGVRKQCAGAAVR